jgi:hypothetical protein
MDQSSTRKKTVKRIYEKTRSPQFRALAYRQKDSFRNTIRFGGFQFYDEDTNRKFGS